MPGNFAAAPHKNPFAAIHLRIPADLLGEIDPYVRARQRSRFIVESSQRELLRRKQLDAIQECTGAWSDEDHPDLSTTLDSLLVLPMRAAESKLAAILMRGRGPGYVDCDIAATALLGSIPLVTYNHGNYERTGVNLLDASRWDPRLV